MSTRDRITHFLANLLVERPLKNKSVATLIPPLETSGDEIARRVDVYPDTDLNRKTLAHIIGIERWGQQRLKVALGGTLQQDEYNAYRPAIVSWKALQDEFHSTRADTIAIAQEIARSSNTVAVIPHNQYGDMSVKGWLRYLNLHAYLESKRMR